MVQLSASLDDPFAALADGTRRAVLDRLRRADASISQLAQAFRMTLTGMKKHVATLERAGFVATRKDGRVRTCTLAPHGFAAQAAWMEQYRRLWDARFTELDTIVDDLKRKEPIDE